LSHHSPLMIFFSLDHGTSSRETCRRSQCIRCAWISSGGAAATTCVQTAICDILLYVLSLQTYLVWLPRNYQSCRSRQLALSTPISVQSPPYRWGAPPNSSLAAVQSRSGCRSSGYSCSRGDPTATWHELVHHRPSSNTPLSLSPVAGFRHCGACCIICWEVDDAWDRSNACCTAYHSCKGGRWGDSAMMRWVRTRGRCMHVAHSCACIPATHKEQARLRYW
jgi:hypothetical protein